LLLPVSSAAPTGPAHRRPSEHRDLNARQQVHGRGVIPGRERGIGQPVKVA
jgi:hypothetical protein